MKKNKLNHNFQIMFGIMAAAVVLLGVVIFFWMWCFPITKGAEVAEVQRTLTLKSMNLGDNVILVLDDSTLYEGCVTDSIMTFTNVPQEGCVLMLMDVGANTMYSFNIEQEAKQLMLRREDGKVTFESRK